MHLELSSFREKLEQILDTYSSYLHSELIDLLEKIAHSSFLHMATQAYTLPSADRQYGIKRGNYPILSGMEKLVKEHVILMLQLIEYYNLHSDSRIEFDQAEWSDRVAPNWGSSRI